VFADRSNDWRLAREEIFGERRRLLELARVDLAPPGLMLAMTPGCNVSATIRIFSSFDQRRRRSAPSRTSTRIRPDDLKARLKVTISRNRDQPARRPSPDAYVFDLV
jgi:hypothetical protein